MQIFKHTGHIAYVLRKNLVIIKYLNHKIQWFAKIKGKPVLVNFKFIVSKGFILIRLPFFYFNEYNSGIEVGLPNLYLWVIK